MIETSVFQVGVLICKDDTNSFAHSSRFPLVSSQHTNSLPHLFLGHAVCLCFTESRLLQNHWYKALGECSRASCIEERSNTLRSSTDVCLPSEDFQTSENRFHNVHVPVLVLPCVEN